MKRGQRIIEDNDDSNCSLIVDSNTSYHCYYYKNIKDTKDTSSSWDKDTRMRDT